MNLYIILSAAVFAAGLIFVIRRHPDLRNASMVLTLTISLAAAVLYYPYHRLKMDPLLALLSAINSGLKTVAMDVKADAVSSLAMTGATARAYQALLYLYYVLAPVCGSIFILTVSKSLFDRLMLKKADHIHIFSSLNKNSMELMEYLIAQYPDDRIMILGKESDDESLAKRTSAIRAVFWDRDLEKLKLYKGIDYTFYQMDKEDEENLTAFMRLIRYIGSQTQEIIDRTQVKCFVSSDSDEMVRRIDRYLSGSSGKTIKISYLNIQNNQAYYLFHQLKDLIPLPEGRFEFAVIGAGSTGIACAKTALWLFDRQDCELVIHIVDRHARKVADHLKLSCPEVLNAGMESYFSGFDDPQRNYDIRFYEEDADGYGLEKVFGEMDVHPDLVIAACGDDVTNHRISERIRRILCRRNNSISCCPIAVRIRRDETFEVLNETNDKDSNVYYFGCQSEKFAQVFAINTILEKMAVRVHMAYLNTDTDDVTKTLYETGYYNLANHESSLAMALALEYKVKYILRHTDLTGKDRRTVLEEYLQDEENMKKMCRMEHLRWNTYQRISGWTRPTWQQTEMIAKMHNNGRKIRHDRLLMHPAIVGNDELAETEKKADAILRSITPDYAPTDYVRKDEYILARIPEITAEE